jgi:8-oxo-dGTP diphosphatase/2-hydroxy-dATP diphosphatase
MKKLLTLCIIHNDTHILLGMKKRGFGAGRWNGFGGKVIDGESIEEAVKRELKEEIGLIVTNLEKNGILDFSFENNPKILEVHIFRALDFEGEPIESEEMQPQWFLKEKIPFELMWPGDKYWLPLFLEGKKLCGNFHFAADEKNILQYNIKEVLKI